jgi:hypothetical protein
MRMLRGRSMRSSLYLGVVGMYLIMLHRFISSVRGFMLLWNGGGLM